MKLHRSKPPILTMSIAPSLTTKLLFPKLHHSTCAPYHFYPKQLQLSQTKTSIKPIHKHILKRHTSIKMSSKVDSEERITTIPDVMISPPSDQVIQKRHTYNTVGIMGLHILCVFAPFTFNWKAVQVAIGLDILARFIGINVSFHRQLSHRSFKLPKWLEYTFAYCGTHSLQGSPIDWVRTHRIHHQNTDTEIDPHTPLKGFWFSHILWMFDGSNTDNMVETNSLNTEPFRAEWFRALLRGYQTDSLALFIGPGISHVSATYDTINQFGEGNYVTDLENQPFYRFLSRTYLAHPIALALVLYALGGHPFTVWGMGVRTVVGYHTTWLVNSVCHGAGDQTWDSKDLSLNKAWVGILGYGDGWHNNHHAFEYSARHGLEWWQVDIAWYFIRFLEIIGVATDVKLPTPADIKRKTFPLKEPYPL